MKFKVMVDENLSPCLAEVLKAVGIDAVHVTDMVQRGASDVTWIPVAGEQQRMVIGADARLLNFHIFSNNGENLNRWIPCFRSKVQLTSMFL